MVGRPAATRTPGHALHRRQRRDQGRRLRPHRSPRPATRPTWSAPTTAALIAVQGPEAGAVLARDPAGGGRPQLHDVDAASRSKATDVIVSRSGYTGEDGFEILVPAAKAARALGPAAAADERVGRSAWARAIRCASRPACRSTATTSTRPSRRSRPAWLRRLEAPREGRRLPAARRASRASWPDGSTARARRPAGRWKARRPARARRSSMRSGARGRPASPAAASRRALGAPIAMGYVPPAVRRARRARSASSCAARRRRAEVVADAVRPPPLPPQAG